MRITPDYPQRRTIALPGHDYQGPNSYFVTMRARKGQHIFGEVVNGVMHLNSLGKVVEEEWLRTPLVRSYVSLDAFVVMPNHFHGIIDLNVSLAIYDGRCEEAPPLLPARGSGPAAGSLSAILGQFKSTTSKKCRALGYDSRRPLWLRRWHDRLIRTESEKADIRRYIWDNPIRWEQRRLTAAK